MKISTTTLTLSLIALLPGLVSAKEIAESSKSKIPLSQIGSNTTASGSVDFSSKKGRSTFQLRIKKGPPSESVELFVGGVSRGTFQTSSKGALKLKLSGAALDFDPRGQEIELEDAGDDKFLSGGGTNITAGSSFDERANLDPTGLQPLAKGHAKYRVKKGAGRFTVEIENVTNGTYDLLVDGVAQGQITAVAGRGEIEFGDSGQPALTFDPVGKVVQVALNGDIVLASTFLASAPGVSVCTPAETTTVLVPTAVAPSASGDARLRVRDNCRRDFRVEIEDVPVGAYDVFVASTNRGTLTVAVQLDLKVQGEIEFSSVLDDSPSNELPLDFDPAGQTIEIKQGTNVFLSATGGTTTTGTCSVVNNEVDFTTTGLDGDAKGKSRFRQDAGCGRDLRVEVEKLTVGSYDLKVGGLLRGTISVTGAGSNTLGEVEFDTEPTPGKLLLNFDPRGQSVEVLQGTNLFLSVTMPN